MSAVFLDTAGLVAVVNSDDHWHQHAETVWNELIRGHAQLVTSSLVLIEIGDGLSKIHHRALAFALCDRLRKSSQIEVIQVTPQVEARAWELFRQRADKEWGLTDCASFILMTDHGITEAFSADRHFEQAGFRILLKL